MQEIEMIHLSATEISDATVSGCNCEPTNYCKIKKL